MQGKLSPMFLKAFDPYAGEMLANFLNGGGRQRGGGAMEVYTTGEEEGPGKTMPNL